MWVLYAYFVCWVHFRQRRTHDFACVNRFNHLFRLFSSFMIHIYIMKRQLVKRFACDQTVCGLTERCACRILFIWWSTRLGVHQNSLFDVAKILAQVGPDDNIDSSRSWNCLFFWIVTKAAASGLHEYCSQETNAKCCFNANQRSLLYSEGNLREPATQPKRPEYRMRATFVNIYRLCVYNWPRLFNTALQLLVFIVEVR